MIEIKKTDELAVKQASKLELLKASAKPKAQGEIAPVKAAPADNMLACRYELKYVISHAKARAIQKFISMYLDMDMYSRLQPNGYYIISSLYLDSHNLQLFRESAEGHKNRFKLRVRSYNDVEDSPIFFEIKRRMNNIIIKSRARTHRNEVAELLGGKIVRPKMFQEDEQALRHFQLYMFSINAGPIAQIKYRRLAYEGNSDNRVRVTFDIDLCSRTTSQPEVKILTPGWQPINLGGVILEIKFTGRFPLWLNQMVKIFGLQIQSVSKYANAVKNGCMLGFCAPKLPIRF